MVYKLVIKKVIIENFDKPPISTNCLYRLYKQLAKNWGLSKSSIIGLFFLFAVCILVFTITLAAADNWDDSESPNGQPITLNTGTFIVTPTITWSNPADIAYGTPLSGTQLNATSPESGSFTYNPATGTVLSAGQNQQLTATFTPTDTANYTTATDTVYINVDQATPTITWTPNPLADIVYGTTLGADLDATATDPTTGNPVDGNFIYTDETGTVVNAGTVLSIGTHALTATFTPTDTANYNPVTSSVPINVLPPVPGAALTILKSVSPTTYASVGQTITYTYKVTNNGNVNILAPITVTDDKLGTVPIQRSGTLSPSSSVTGTATYKITDADINTGYVTNLAYATGSSNNQPIVSPINIVIVPYKHLTNERDNNDGPYNVGYDSYCVPAPIIYGTMYGSEPYGYGSRPYGTTEVPNSESHSYKAKVYLSKHNHKNHSKHHKAGNNHSKHHKARNNHFKHHKAGKKSPSVK